MRRYFKSTVSCFFLLLACAFLMPCKGILAAPSVPQAFEITQGGNTFSIWQKGDESLSWYETSQGLSVRLDASGNWEILKSAGNFSWASSGNVLSSDLDVTQFETAPFFYSGNLRELKAQRFVQASSIASSPKTGELNLLVVLAYFSDHASHSFDGETFSSANVSSNLHRELINGSQPSVQSFFAKESGNALQVQGHVTKWLPLPKNEADYLKKPRDLVSDAVNRLSQSTDSGVVVDGSIHYDAVVVIHSGMDQARAMDGKSSRLWSQSGTLSSNLSIFGGNITVKDYAIAAGFGGNTQTEVTDLGVLCHEIGHLLGLPDTYEYQEAGYGVGAWDLMALGVWGFSGNQFGQTMPPPFGAWSRLQLGWGISIEKSISEEGIKLYPVQDQKEIWRFNTSRSTEYFLVENRDPRYESWQGTSMLHPGFLIWHIDEEGWQSKISANLLHPLVKIEEADGNDSLGLSQWIAEEGDLWSGNSIKNSFAIGAGSTGYSSLYEDGHYYQRPSGNVASYVRLDSFLEQPLTMSANFIGPKSKIEIDDFLSGRIKWNASEGATGYELERQIGTGGTPENLPLGSDNLAQLTFSENISGTLEYRYRVRATHETGKGDWSAVLVFGLQVDTANFNAQTGVLSLDWNLPIKVLGQNGFKLSGISIKRGSGELVFPITGGNSSSYLYPAIDPKDKLNAERITSSDNTRKIEIQLSDAQRYQWIKNSSLQNDNFVMEVAPQTALAELATGNILNAGQTILEGTQIAISSQRDLQAPVMVSATYHDDTGDLVMGFDEPLYAPLLDPSKFSIKGATGWSTPLFSATNTFYGNILTFRLSARDRIRTILIKEQNNGQMVIGIPSDQVKDLSGVSAQTTDFSQVVETADSIPPFVENFSFNGHDESRILSLSFTEPVFFINDQLPQTAAEIGFVLGGLADGVQSVLGGNALGADLNDLKFQVGVSDNFLNTLIPAPTTGVTIKLSSAEVDRIDAFYDELYRDKDAGRVFASPLPKIHGWLTRDGVFGDYKRYLDQSFVVDKDTVSVSSDYTPRRRARLVHPHFDPAITTKTATQESLIWKWQHRIIYEINKGWGGTELLRLEWENDVLGGNVIKASLAFSGNATKGSLDTFQSVVWDTTKESDATGYVLKILRNDRSVLYDKAPRPLEIDNTRPQVTIRYISNSNPSYKVNANDLVDAVHYDSLFNLTQEEKDTANVLVVATYTEPVIEAPVLSINQQGSADIAVTMTGSKGLLLEQDSGFSDNIFYYAYDVKTQDAGNYTDGIANVSLSSVQDRAVGHLLVELNKSPTSEDIEGNRALAPSEGNLENLRFLIDTIPPTISSLEFVIENESIVESQSTLRLFYSEDLYRLSSEADPTPLDASHRPITGVLNPENYVITGTGATALHVLAVEGSGLGPYLLTLDGVINRGSLALNVSTGTVKDFHLNPIASPIGVSALWPGPLRNRSEVLLSVGGRTRLLMSGGFPPYRLNINDYYSSIAIMDSVHATTILGKALGRFTVEVTESRNQTRFVNAEVLPPYPAKISGNFQAFRDELDYRMVGFPFHLPSWDGKGLKQVLSSGMGEFGVEYILYYFDENGQYQAVSDDSLAVGPGYGFWMASRKKRPITVEGEGPLPLQVVGVDLQQGWNLIGNPFDVAIDLNQIYVSIDGFRFALNDLSQSQTQHEIWTIDITKPQYETIARLEPFQGAWLYVNRPEGVELVFYRGTIDPSFRIDYDPVSLSKSEEEAIRSAPSPYPPSRPGAFNLNSSSSVSGRGVAEQSAGGGGGCLLW